MKYTTYVPTDQYYLRNMEDKKDVKTPFGEIETIPVDLNAAIVQEKQANGMGKDTEMLQEAQENIHTRFGLQTKDDFKGDNS
jgi:hypothetical protein